MELSIPMLKVGGRLLALKSLGVENEIDTAKNVFRKLDSHLEKVIEDYLPESKEYRATVYIQKDKITNNKYPRDYAIIKDRKL